MNATEVRFFNLQYSICFIEGLGRGIISHTQYDFGIFIIR